MRFEFDKKNWTNITEGEKDLLSAAKRTGRLQQSVCDRGGSKGWSGASDVREEAPNVREHLVSNIFEKLVIDGQEYILTSQRMQSGKD